MLSILVVGTGRMGKELERVITEDDNLNLVGLVGQSEKETLRAGVPAADVVIDFSHKDMLPLVKAYIDCTKAALVSGTTGYTQEDTDLIQDLSKQVPVIQASNYSLGVAVLRKLSAQAAKYLKEWDIEIVETHHNQKVDAPSGTALSLLESVQSPEKNEVLYGRSGMIGKRSSAEIGMHALRGGTVAGTHAVHFFGLQEEIELTHRATNRAIFATGAVAAAKKLALQPAGLYTFDSLMFDTCN
ncbi:MAG: 4-hydroxy-tetrahydrodipicolinate reductase [Eggerthellaceae bacterium]|nr:4-hydroxy-tetrahydrodipicolinate reductase [Eggerthellaceae bacterium]